MRKLLTCLGLLVSFDLPAQPDHELTYRLKASVAKVHVTTKNGGHGVGTGVVVGKDLVATNCHILANATGVNITKFGDSHAPVALKADWKHDVCILQFQYLEMPPAELGDSENLQYEQPIFSIGFPGGPPKPQVTYGKIKALYPYENATIIRTDASFVMGASGSPVFDSQGRLIALSTFKSPGKSAYFYNIPVKWVKALLDAPETSSMATNQTPFWDAPEDSRPNFMQIVLPYLNDDWTQLKQVSEKWIEKEPSNEEAHFYLAIALANLGEKVRAKTQLDKTLALRPSHPSALMALGLMADDAGETKIVEHTHTALKAIDESLDEEFRLALEKQAKNQALAQ